MSWAAVHRWCAIVLVALLVVWSVSGLLFHLKPGWDRAYDMLSADRGKIETLDTAVGPLTRASGKLATTLSVEDAEKIARDALQRSSHRGAYGAVTRVTSDATSVTLECEHARVRIDRASARISQRGADTERIDWLYRIHYLQWTGNATLDKVLAFSGLMLIWAVMIPGVVLFMRRITRPA
jgi:hypothetical protein